MPEKQENAEITDAIHQYYMDIINALPDIVYWVDVDSNLLGCNNQFVSILGLNTIRDFHGTPYEQMKKFAHWSDECVERIRLDDMKAIFSGVVRSNIIEKPIFNEQNQAFYFRSNRVPRYDENKNIIGLTVVLTALNGHELLDAKHIGTVHNVNGGMLHKDLRDFLPKILMIEDNIIAQNVEKALLIGLNCVVDVAGSGEEALALFEPGKYDLVFMDIGLEGTSGYVVAKELRKLEKDSGHTVPIIALTGYQADVVKYDCEQYSMQGAITKPLSKEQAEQIIKHYIYKLDEPVKGLKKI